MEVLQITDLHLDPMYTPGNNALCGFYSCCKASQGPAQNSSAAAGYWGDYRNCDMPVHAFQNMLDQIVATHPVIFLN
jgi:sphingomyelin phosphodiesterase